MHTFYDPENNHKISCICFQVTDLKKKWRTDRKGRLPVPEVARSKAWVCGRPLAKIVGSNPAECRTSVSCECCVCHVEVSASGWSLVQRSPTKSECDREFSKWGPPWPTRGCRAMERKESCLKKVLPVPLATPRMANLSEILCHKYTLVRWQGCGGGGGVGPSHAWLLTYFQQRR